MPADASTQKERAKEARDKARRAREIAYNDLLAARPGAPGSDTRIHVFLEAAKAEVEAERAFLALIY